MTKLKKIINENKANIFLVGCTFIFFLINLFDIASKIGNNRIIILSIYGIVSIVLCIAMTFFIKKTINRYHENIPILFIVSASFLGFIYLFLSPLFSGSDEHNHYYRVYEISNGILVTPTNKYVGSKMPKSLYTTFNKATGNNTTVKYKNIKDMIRVNKNSKNIQYGDIWAREYSNTALYSPVQYLPQVIGVSIGKLLGANPYIMAMMGRIINLLFFIILGYLALKIIPKFKMFYLFILLSPNMLQCATTLSADAFTNIIFLLLIAYIFKIYYGKKMISKKEKIVLSSLSIVISLCKIVYLPIVFLLLLIDKSKFKNGNKEKTIFSLITILLSIIVSLIWMRCTNGIFEVAYDKTELQKAFIFRHLFKYGIIFLRTFSVYAIKYIECLFVGTTMYHSQLAMPGIVSFFYIGLAFASLLQEKSTKMNNKYARPLIASIGILIIGLVCTAIYIQCTAQYFSVGNPTIEGIQGRYFIPVIMLMPFILNFKKISVKKTFLLNSALIVNLITWFYMISTFIA